MAERILVTGGCGFIGSNFIHYIFKNTDYEVLNIDCMTYAGNQENLDGIDCSRYNFIQKSINNFNEIKDIINRWKPETIVHFAAESHVDNSINNPDIFIKTNILGTFNLLEASKDVCMKFIHISSDEVFGSLLSDDEAFTELSPYAPNSPYSASKASSDLLARSYFQTYNMPVVITNCSNNYGPRQHTEKLIPKIISNAINNKQIPIYGDGKQIRDWLFVEDHCSAILKIMESSFVGESYNIGGDCEKENIEITHTILRILNKPTSLIQYVDDRLGHDRRYAVNCERLKSCLNWAPKIDLEAGLEKTIEWYKKKNE